MPPHNPQPHLTLVSTHRATIVSDEWCAEHLQAEEYEPRVYTEDEYIFGMYVGGFVGIVIAVVAVFLWQAVAS